MAEMLSFRFILRGTDSLAYKWIKEERGNGYFDNGVNIFALCDYFYTTAKLDKIFPALLDNVNKFTSKFKTMNEINDNSHIIRFNDELLIPITNNEIQINKSQVSGFSDIATLLESHLPDLNHQEIQNLAVTMYHALYDFRNSEGVRGKTYNQIIKKPVLYFGRNSKLSLFAPSRIQMNITNSTTVADNKTIVIAPNVQKPSVNKKMIVIDPGHGGSWNGDIKLHGDCGNLVDSEAKPIDQLETGCTREDVQALKVSLALKDKLISNSQYQVYLTRESAILPLPTDYEYPTSGSLSAKQIIKKNDSLKYRGQFAIEKNANIFISIHFNSGGTNNEKSGVQIYYNYSGDRTKYLREIIEKTIKVKGISMNASEGSQLKGDWAVYREAGKTIPSILLEAGFMTNKAELTRINSPQHIEKLAEGIYNGINEYFFEY